MFLGTKINQPGVEGERDEAKIRLNPVLDQWLKTVKSRICSKTYESFERLLAKYIRPSLGKKLLVSLSSYGWLHLCVRPYRVGGFPFI